MSKEIYLKKDTKEGFYHITASYFEGYATIEDKSCGCEVTLTKAQAKKLLRGFDQK